MGHSCLLAVQLVHDGVNCGQFNDNSSTLSYMSYVDDVLAYSHGANREQTVSELRDELDRIDS